MIYAEPRRCQAATSWRRSACGEFPEFAATIALIGTDGEFAALIAELTETFARVYLGNARDIPTTIAFIHGVTSHAALGNITPHIGDAAARKAMRHAWQAGCGLYACYGSGAAIAEALERPALSEDELVERAIAHGDEHVIKFTEACLSRNGLAPSPAYPAAAFHAESMIPARRPR